nr:hypothetical protein [Bacteroidota bacterium]
MSVSYSARQNVIYYETYKSFIDRLLEDETLQGFMLQLNYRPLKRLSVGLRSGYRYRKDDPRDSKNLYGYITMSQVPGLHVAATLSVTVLETAYLSGKIYSLGFTRDLIPGKLNGGISYRYVDYKFYSTESSLKQNMGEFYLTWKIYKKLFCSVNYEGTFEKVNSYNRVFVSITQRF